MKRILALILATVMIGASLAGCGESNATGESTAAATEAAAAGTTNAAEADGLTGTPSIHWRKDTTGKYLNDDKVQSLVCVQATGGTYARVLMYVKSTEDGKTIWTKTLECQGYIGLNGLGKEKEGDNKTPIGDFGIITAFGIKENPGTSLDYVDVTEDIYCCGDSNYYNQIIDIKENPHDCNDSEHLIEYTPEYNYGIFIDYNADCTIGLGSAIFFHCSGANTYTGGCIAVDEENMVQIIETLDMNSRIIIDYAPSEVPGY